MKKLTKGLRRDEKAIDQPENTWVDARNIVVTKANGTISNEDSFINITPPNFPGGPTVPITIGVIVTNTKKIMFFGSTNPADSEIGIIDENLVYTTIVKDSILNFHQDHPIQGVFQIKFNDNIVIAWTDSTQGKWNPYRILNLTCLPFGIEPDYSITPADLNKAKALLSIFPEIKSPILSDFNFGESGGNLSTGVYYPIVAYTLADNSDTSWFSILNPISVVADNVGNTSINYDGNLGGVFTGKLLNIDFTDIDTNYKYLKFGYIKLENGVYSAQYVNSYLINGSTLTVEFTDAENSKSDLTLDEVLTPNSIYPYGKTITTVLNKLFLGNLETEQELDFQPYANNIELKWVYEEDVNIYEPLVSDSSKKEKTIYFNKSFKDDEVYAYYIALRNKTSGKWSKAFTIPGREINVGDSTDISGLSLDFDALDTGNPVPKYRVLETAVVTSTVPDPSYPANKNNLEGDFGFWENEDETYPNVSSFDSSGLGGLDLRGQKVRHHKYPSSNFLAKNQPVVINNGFNYVDKRDKLVYSSMFNNGAGRYTMNLTPSINEIGWLNGTYGVHGVFTNPAYGAYGSCNFNRITFYRKNKIKVKIELKIYIGAMVIAQDFRFRITRQAITDIVYYDSGNVTFPPSGGYQIIYAEFDVEDTFQTGFSISPNTIINYYIMIDDVLAGGNLNVTSVEGGLYIHDFERTTTTTKALGVKVSNVVLPAGYEDIYDEWGIFYAKRSSNNIRALGNDMFKTNRLHTFDLMAKQAAVKASYLKEQVCFFMDALGSITTGGHGFSEKDLIFDYTVPITFPTIYHIRKFEYAGENTNLNGVNNTDLASNIYIEAGKALPSSYNNTDLANIISKYNILVDLMVYRKNVYNSFQTQELIFTGKSFKITASGVQATQKIYGGDVFNTYHGFLDANITTSPRQWSLPVSAASNIGFRMDDEVLGKYYYPKHLGYETIKPTVSFYLYNFDYSALNDLQKVFPATFDNGCFEDIYLFPQRIAYSLTEGNEANKINWRIFKISDYYDMPKNKGVIWNLLGNDRILYIHHEYSLFIAQIKDRLNTSGEETYLGISDLFDRPPIEILPVREGYAGNSSQFATIVCKLGYCFIDRVRGSIFIYNDKLEEISEEGLSNFWFKNAQYSDPTKDNPFIGMGYTIAYDDENDRLMITKKDTGLDAFSFTMSYYSIDKYFIAFHDYLPYFMFNNREGIFYVNNFAATKRLYKNGNQLTKGVFFNDDNPASRYPSYVDVVFNEKKEFTKRFQAVKWLSEVEQADGVKLEDKTITHLAVYNSNQCSGMIPTQDGKNLWFGHDRKNVEETWTFNDFRDLLKDASLPFLNQDNFILPSAIDTSKVWFKRSQFLSKFVIVRFYYDNLDDNDFYLIAVDTNYNISTKGL